MADKTVVPVEDFTGYPKGKKVEFKTGVHAKVPAKYAELLQAKGHIEENGSAPDKADD